MRTAGRRAGPGVYSDAFLQFWAAYPRRVGKGGAWAEFQRLHVGAAEVEAMLGALDWQVRQRQWVEDGGQYIPYPATWLHQRRWEDEPFHPEPRGVSARPAWVCPHDPPCEVRRFCDLKVAKAALGFPV